MTTIPETCAPVNAQELFEAALTEVGDGLRAAISTRLNALLVAVVSYVIGRGHYARRADVPRHLKREGVCCRCGSRCSQRFSRNGFRQHQPLTTPWGEIDLAVPRVRYECGGSVQIDFGGLLRPYQRISDEVDAQIQRLGHLALSLRQMNALLSQLFIGPLALRSLNQRLHLLATLDPQRDATDVPPILQVDAV